MLILGCSSFAPQRKTANEIIQQKFVVVKKWTELLTLWVVQKKNTIQRLRIE